MVTTTLFDERPESPSKGKYQEINLSPENYFLVTIPPNIWNGFKGLYKPESIIANCLNLPHNEKEMVRKDHIANQTGKQSMTWKFLGSTASKKCPSTKRVTRGFA